MIKTLRVVLILFAALTAPVWATQSPMGLATAFGALPQRSLLTLSSSGRMLAWLQPLKSRTGVVIYDIDTHAIRRVIKLDPALTLTALDWTGDNTLLMNTVSTMRWPGEPSNLPLQLSRVVAVDTTDGKSRILLGTQLGKSFGASAGYFDASSQLLDYEIPKQPHTVIMSTDTGKYEHALRLTLFSVDTRTGLGTPIAYGDADTLQWFVNPDGNPVARSEGKANRYTIEAKLGGRWRQIYRIPRGVDLQQISLDPALRAILTLMSARHGPARVWVIPLDGSTPRPLFPAAKSGVHKLMFSHSGERLNAVLIGNAHHWRWLDTAAKLRFESVRRAFPGRRIKLFDRTRDGREGLAEVESATSPPIYYLVNYVTHRAMIAGEEYPQLAHVALAKARTVHYRMRDGTTIDAEVFLPPGTDKDLPLVVLAPGRPVARNPQTFDWFAQYLAASGYVVLRPDFSLTPLPGYSNTFEWGGFSQRYAIDGIHLLIKQGVVDPRRVCVVGVGYGGYAALAGAAFYPKTYACAVSINGVSDLPSLLAHEFRIFRTTGAKSAIAIWRSHIGSLFDSKMIAESPVHAV